MSPDYGDTWVNGDAGANWDGTKHYKHASDFALSTAMPCVSHSPFCVHHFIWIYRSGTIISKRAHNVVKASLTSDIGQPADKRTRVQSHHCSSVHQKKIVLYKSSKTCYLHRHTYGTTTLGSCLIHSHWRPYAPIDGCYITWLRSYKIW